MGQVRVIQGKRVRDVALSTSNRVGRHWSSDIELSEETAPLHWLELRWRNHQWCWRPLPAEARTRGTGAGDEFGWRAWAQVGGRVRLDGCDEPVEVQLVDAAAPKLLVENLADGHRHENGVVDQLIETWVDGRAWPLGADPSSDAPLRDGQVFQRAGEVYRCHLPTKASDTDRVSFDLSDSNVELDIDAGHLRSVFGCGSREAVATGECVRVLAVYAGIRCAQAGTGEGWMATSAAHEAWFALGGRADSPPERLAWERGKLRTQLGKQGVCGLERLFETRRRGKVTEVRLSVSPERVHLVEPRAEALR